MWYLNVKKSSVQNKNIKQPAQINIPVDELFGKQRCLFGFNRENMIISLFLIIRRSYLTGSIETVNNHVLGKRRVVRYVKVFLFVCHQNSCCFSTKMGSEITCREHGGVECQNLLLWNARMFWIGFMNLATILNLNGRNSSLQPFFFWFHKIRVVNKGH